MDKVKEALTRGATLATAVRALLVEQGSSLNKFAVKHGIDRSNLASGLSGNGVLREKEIEALIAEFGGTQSEWRDLLVEAVKTRYHQPAPAANQ